jgi:D-beta-D-heptose 7-phosphate kinase/D-beta-D-heptose 1-phosphate adenosyltransferase
MKGLSKKRFREIIRRIRGKNIIVLGDLILDKYVWGRVGRISPEAPVPVVEVKTETLRLGGCANVAENLKSMGISPLCVGTLGRDHEAGELRRQFRKQRLSTAGFVVDTKKPTTVKTRVMAHHQQVVRIDREDDKGISPSVRRKVAARVSANLRRARAVIISDYGKGVIASGLVAQVVAAAGGRTFIAVDPKPKHLTSYHGATLMTPNQKEAEELTRIRIEDNKSLMAAGRELIGIYGLSACLITLGEHGMALFDQRGRMTRIQAVASEVYDVTGAGDTVIGVFSAAVAGGASLLEAAMMANGAAGLVVREVGAASVTPAQLEKAYY